MYIEDEAMPCGLLNSAFMRYIVIIESQWYKGIPISTFLKVGTMAKY
jgi:hypothetical protein